MCSCYDFCMKKNIAPHVTSLLTGAGAVLAIIHPGFKIPAGVEGLIASLCVLSTTFVQSLHLVKKSNLDTNIALANHLVNQAVANIKTDTATPA